MGFAGSADAYGLLVLCGWGAELHCRVCVRRRSGHCIGDSELLAYENTDCNVIPGLLILCSGYKAGTQVMALESSGIMGS
jgi:hypothetical protein